MQNFFPGCTFRLKSHNRIGCVSWSMLCFWVEDPKIGRALIIVGECVEGDLKVWKNKCFWVKEARRVQGLFCQADSPLDKTFEFNYKSLIIH